MQYAKIIDATQLSKIYRLVSTFDLRCPNSTNKFILNSTSKIQSLFSKLGWVSYGEAVIVLNDMRLISIP